MTIDHVGLRLQSASLDVESLVAIAGIPPARSAERGAPLSSRLPEGHVHEVSTAVFEQAGAWDSLGMFVEAMGPLLDRVRTSRRGSEDLRVDLLVSVTARPLGYIIQLDPGHVAALGAAGCGLAVDSYSFDGGEDLGSDG